MEVSQARLPLALHIEHSALPMVIIRVCLFSLWAFLVTFLVDSKVVDASRLSHLGTAMTGILSMVVGLMVSFRSESSTSRWKDGRNVWESVSSRTRNLMRTLTLSLPINEFTDELTKERIEDLLGLVVAFPVALRHHLRGERGISQPDLDGLLPREYVQSLRRTPSSVRFAPHPVVTQIPSHNSSSSLVEMLPLPPGRSASISSISSGGVSPSTPRFRTSSVPSDEKTKQQQMLNVPSTTTNSSTLSLLPSPLSADDKPVFTQSFTPASPTGPLSPQPTLRDVPPPPLSQGRRLSSALSPSAPANLPLSILRLMHAYLDGLVSTGVMKEGMRERCFAMLEGLSDDLGKAESIRDTPIPLPLSIHLHQMLSLFLLSIPPQLAPTLGSWTIPVTGIATFCFLGVDSIGEKLSEPFGPHATALPLHSFTDQLLQEAMELGGVFATSYLSRLSKTRRPISPGAGGEAEEERRTAEEKETLRVTAADWERRTERWMPYFGGRRGDWRKGSIS